MEKISRGIVITTSKHTRAWLESCIRSVVGPYPILIVWNDSGEDSGRVIKLGSQKIYSVANSWNGFELGGISRGKEFFEEFIHLMDTCIIKDKSIFEKIFIVPGHVFFTEGGFHYMGKFVSKDLPEIPRISTKKQAIEYELNWLREKTWTGFKPNLPVITEKFVEKHGRTNMVLENDFMIKYKATWA